MNHEDNTQKLTARVLLEQASSLLAEAGIENPGREARLLLAHALNTDLTGLIRLGPDSLVPNHDLFVEMVQRRAQREPMAFITGESGFWTLTFDVSRDTLIPRADSETLIESLLDIRRDRKSVRDILDLGCGTGCLLLSALSEYPDAHGVGVDLSYKACQLASRNAQRNGLSDRAHFIAGSWGDALNRTFDVVVSNPPYIPTADVALLMPEVVNHEPSRALDGGVSGLDAYKLLISNMKYILSRDGVAIFEIGIGQEHSVPLLAESADLEVVEVRKDLGGIPRAVVMKWSGQKNS